MALPAITACATSLDSSRTAWPGFKFAMCNESLQDLPWHQQCELMASAGYTGVEIAPFSLLQQSVRELDSNDRAELISPMNDNGLGCVGLHWLLSPPPEGLHFTTPDTKIRLQTQDYFQELIDFCADLGGEVMIFGSPKQRSTTPGQSIEQAKARFVESLLAVADHAQQRGVKILVETLTSNQTDVVITMAEAMQIVSAYNHPAIGTMFDFHNTLDERESLEELVRKYIGVIDHIQIQEMDGRHLGTGTGIKDYAATFKALRELRFNKWISLEVFDFSPPGRQIAEKSMKVLRALAQS